VRQCKVLVEFNSRTVFGERFLNFALISFYRA